MCGQSMTLLVSVEHKWCRYCMFRQVTLLPWKQIISYLSTTHYHDNSIKHPEAAILCVVGKRLFNLNMLRFCAQIISA